MRRTRRHALALLLLAGLLASCKTSFELEGRDTPVHVWIESPSGGVVDLAVRVGDAVAVDGPVRFPPGTTRVAVPPLYLRAGDRPVVVTGADGRPLATANASVKHATWILVSVRGAAVGISVFDREPGTRD